MSTKIETLKSEYERAAETDVFRTGENSIQRETYVIRTGDTAYKQILMSSEQVIQHKKRN